MHLLDLPTELLATILLDSITATTRQKRRQQLLQLSTVCRAFNAICLQQLYAKLAYEISPKGYRLLDTLNRVPRYAKIVRALAIREKETFAGRKLINSRVEEGRNASSGANTSLTPAGASTTTDVNGANLTRRARKSALDAILLDEAKISSILHILMNNLVELKYETNLLPDDDDAFANLGDSLRSLTMVPQPPYPEAADHESIARAALFTLPLSLKLFMPAFLAFKHLRHLDLWKCSFAELDTQMNDDGLPGPPFALTSLVLQECAISSKTLQWLLKSTVAAASLRTLKINYLIIPSSTASADDRDALQKSIQDLIRQTAASLHHFSFEGDEGELDEPRVVDVAGTPLEDSVVNGTLGARQERSPLAALAKLETLTLGGRAITSHHWLAIPGYTLENLRELVLDCTPRLPPADIIDRLRVSTILSPSGRSMKKIDVRATEDFRRKNIRELLHPTSVSVAWNWTRLEAVTFFSLLEAGGIIYTGDKTAFMENIDDDDDQASSDGEELDLEYDEGADFSVTAEQVSHPTRAFVSSSQQFRSAVLVKSAVADNARTASAPSSSGRKRRESRRKNWKGRGRAGVNTDASPIRI